MIECSLKKIQEMVGGMGLTKSFENVIIKGVSIDSRNISRGNLYIPIIGSRVDGHSFVNDAISLGASAVLWQEGIPEMPADIPVIIVDDTLKALQNLAMSYKSQRNMKVIGITGSNGKTSTKDILSSILATTYRVHKTPGNFNSEFGMPLTLLLAPPDTEIAVLEMGMRGLGQIKQLSDMAKPDISIITCIGEAHIEELKSRENISIAKFEITSGLSDDGLFIYHGDEPLLAERINEASPTFKMISFGQSEVCDYYPTSVNVSGSGMVFTIPQSDLSFELSVLGFHNVMNALSAIAAARHLGVDFHNIQKGLEQVEMSKMRMEIKMAKNGLTIIDDTYNSSPTSVRATLDLMHSLTGYNKKIVVLADMLELGDDAPAYHWEIGKYIDSKEIDELLTYGPLSQCTTNSSAISSATHFESKAEIVNTLSRITGENDICLIKGSRGMGLEVVVDELV